VIASGPPAGIRADRAVQQAYLGYAVDPADGPAGHGADDTRHDLPAVEVTQEIRLEGVVS
jgi:hypothetical protein